MAIKLTKTKDVIQRNIENYQNASTVYSKYFEGSPCFITYYKCNSLASTHDNDLENVHSLTGGNAPRRYSRIFDVAVYGISALDFQNSITERGLESMSSGELYFLPDTIEPVAEDFFTFDIDGMEDHIFRIDDVQFDRSTPHKYYRVSYSLYKENADNILSNIDEGEDLQFIFENIGNGGNVLISSADSQHIEQLKKLYDTLLKKYCKLFYDEEMDLFTCISYKDGVKKGLWSPYVQSFLYEHKLLTAYDTKIMSEFYLQNISSIEFPSLFSDYAYENSIFKKVEMQEPLTKEDNFVKFSGIDLYDYKGLPFAFSPFRYVKLDSYDGTKEFLIDYLPLIGTEDSPYFLELFCLKDKRVGNKVYSVQKELGGMFMVDGELVDIRTVDSTLWNIIRDYISDSLIIDDEVIDQLNRFQYVRNVETYFTLTAILFILRQTISK